VEFKRRVSPAIAKQSISPQAHIERRLGSRAQAIDYARKVETRIDGPFEFGQIEGTQGRRTDIASFKDWFLGEKRSLDDCVDEYPEIVAKYPRFLQTLSSVQRRRQLPAPEFLPNSAWQEELVRYLSAAPHAREIKWFYDQTGNTGKSYFALNYSPGTSYVVTGGKFGDVQYGYLKSGTPSIVFFDWPRDHEDRFPYGLVESFKNGYFLSTKYECEAVRFATPHVIVFSNFLPDQSKLSADRWNIVTLE